MKNIVSVGQSRKIGGHLGYGVLSIACPIVAVASAIIFQSIAHSDFWNSLNSQDDADRTAGAMMAFSEFITLPHDWLFHRNFAGCNEHLAARKVIGHRSFSLDCKRSSSAGFSVSLDQNMVARIMRASKSKIIMYGNS